MEAQTGKKRMIIKSVGYALPRIILPGSLIVIAAISHLLTLPMALGLIMIILLSGIACGYVRYREIEALSIYIRQLSDDRKPADDIIQFLRKDTSLAESLDELQHNWRNKKTQLETMLAESKIVFDTMPDVFVMLNRRLEIIRANSAAHEAFKRNLKWKNCDAISADPVFLQAVQSVLEEETSRSIELRIPENGRDYSLRIERFPVASPGGIALILVMHDITESKRMKQLVSDFVANASHEIRTPLTGIIGLIETIRTSAKDDPQARETFLEMMAEQAKRMNDLVNELLSLSKIEINAFSTPKEIVHVEDIMADCIQQMEALAAEKEMDILVEPHNDLPLIKGDTNELAMVLTNLLSNAIKYGNARTPIHVHVGTTSSFALEIKEALPLECKLAIYIAVSDNGEGISPDHLPRLTERFYRVDKARSRAVGGFGLGLSIVKQIINHHQGALQIESVLGQGSKFTVYLPV
ncbi:MAG: PAS domain-containing protein [Alphaproteobacteria bacterium]|nr:PAS domain-containing protein [Alphaproteobacteria bacterium]